MQYRIVLAIMLAAKRNYSAANFSNGVLQCGESNANMLFVPVMMACLLMAESDWRLCIQ